MSQEIQRFFNPVLVTTACLSGILQGILWTALALVAIFTYEDYISISDNPSDIEYALKYGYLYKVEESVELSDNRNVTCSTFNTFMYVYVVFSFLWFLISSWIFKDCIRDKVYKHTTWLFVTWSLVTMVISVTDMVLMISLICDYCDFEKEVDRETEDIVNYPGLWSYIVSVRTVFWILIVTSGKGFGFLLMNMGFAGTLLKYTKNYLNNNKGTAVRPFINAYDTSSTLPWSSQTSLNPLAVPSNNRNLNESIDNPAFERSKSFSNLETPEEYNSSPFTYSNTSDTNWSFNRARSNTPAQPGRQDDPRNSQPPVYALPRQNNTQENNPRNISPSTNWNLNRNLENTSKPNTSLPSTPNTRTANIESQSRSSPLSNSSSPRIPDPDYTPPNSPRNNLKSVLKPKSNYMW